MRDLATLRSVRGSGSGATPHHDEFVVWKNATGDARERERIGAFAHPPVRVEKLLKPGEVQLVDVSGIRAESGLLGRYQYDRAAGEQPYDGAVRLFHAEK